MKLIICRVSKKYINFGQKESIYMHSAANLPCFPDLGKIFFFEKKTSFFFQKRNILRTYLRNASVSAALYGKFPIFWW